MAHTTPAALLTLAVFAITPFAFGCAAIAGDQTADMTFVVQPHADGTFLSWNELTVDGADGTTQANLLSVTLDTVDPPNTPNMSYLRSIEGTGIDGETQQEFCTATSFPTDEEAVVTTLTFHGNIVPFFSDDKIRINWTGTANPDATFPTAGFTVRARLQVSPQ